MTAADDLTAAGHKLAACDWLVTADGTATHLHAAADLTDEQAGDLYDGGATQVRMLCGLVLDQVVIPGLGDRLDGPRCNRCCLAAGLPRGDGSPKNDAACRAVLEGGS